MLSKPEQTLGSSIKYVTLFFANFDPPPPSHIVGPPESTSHISDPPIFSRPSTKIPYKSPLYKFYLNCSRRFLSGGFVRVGFCPFPLLSQYICYNRKLNITLNLICMIKICISVTSHAPDPFPCTNCHTFSDPLAPSSVTYFMDGP